MKNNDKIAFWLNEEKETFSGWDFSYLDNRWEMDALPWDYFSIVIQYLTSNDKLLDMGTGGGEKLLALNHPLTQCAVTEGFLPNYMLCKEKLEPLGVRVELINEDDLIPYENECFDIVINRHESFRLDEVFRVLKPHGLFITQQVGCDNNRHLSKQLIGKTLKVNKNNALLSN